MRHTGANHLNRRSQTASLGKPMERLGAATIGSFALQDPQELIGQTEACLVVPRRHRAAVAREHWDKVVSRFAYSSLIRAGTPRGHKIASLPAAQRSA